MSLIAKYNEFLSHCVFRDEGGQALSSQRVIHQMSQGFYLNSCFKMSVKDLKLIANWRKKQISLYGEIDMYSIKLESEIGNLSHEEVPSTQVLQGTENLSDEGELIQIKEWVP